MRWLNFMRRLTCVLLGLALPCFAAAQAWIPQRGESVLSFAYQNLDVQDHLFSSDFVSEGVNYGDEVDFGDIRSQTAVIYVDHAFTRRLALGGSLAYVSAKYVGPFPEAPLDDGSYNSELQDLAVTLRYMAVRGPVVVTPFAGVVVPTQNYEVLGHSVVGRNLNELQVGTSVGWFHRPTRYYVQGRYGFSFVESLAGVNMDRTNIDVETGVFFTSRFSGRVFGGYRNVHGGIDWLDESEDEEHAFHIHDQLAATEDIRAGLGVSFVVNPRFQIYASYSATIEGENTHSADLYTVGTSWSFGGRRRQLAKEGERQEAAPAAARLEEWRGMRETREAASLAQQLRY